MKKTSTLFILIFAVTCCVAQNKICKGIKPLPINSPMKNVAVPVKPIVIDENKNAVNVAATQALVQKIPSANNSIASIGLIIGQTTYDLQTNGSIRNAIYKSGNNIGVVWNHSTDLTGTYPDRGTGYNFSNDNGATWQPIPTARIETDRRGFPSIDHLASGGEVFVSHNPTYPPVNGNGIKLSSRATMGIGSWAESQLPPATDDNSIVFLWSRMKTGGSNGNSIHVIDVSLPTVNAGVIYHGMDGAMTYSRSQDGGITWDIQHQILPGMDSTRYPAVRGDSYAIDVNHDIVAICQRSFTNDWALWKSMDNGSTWTKTVIDSFPIPASPNDTIESSTGSVAVLIDNNGTVHCWSNYTRVMMDSITNTFVYFSMDDGLLYWNESFGSNPPVTIASAFDVDGNGIINLTNYGPTITGQSVTTMPSAGIDTAGNIFVSYSSLQENAVYLPDSSNFMHSYVIMSPDNGVTWTSPYDINYFAYQEAVYASIAHEVDNSAHLIYEEDTVPGLMSGFPQNYPNNIIYSKIPTALIANGVTNYLGEINGNIYFDQNGNKIKDAGEFNLQGQKVLLLPDSAYTFTDSSGNYKFYTYSGTHIVQYLPYPNWQITTDSLSYTLTFNGGIFNGYDFGSNGISIVNSMSGDLSGQSARDSSPVSYYQSYTNTGTTILNGSVEIQIDSLCNFVSANPPPAQINGDTLSWTFANLTPFQSRSINFIQQIPGDDYIDSLITTTSKISYDSSSLSVPAVYDTLVQEIVASCDPNDKTVEPVGIGSNHLTLMNEKLKYTIRFQNTGTDTAFKVVIFDTLSAALDVNTFEFLSSSHAVQTFLNANGVLKFVFNNIHLPDSNVNELASHGLVVFRILPKTNLPDPTVVNNEASIYFDFNAAVTTNNVFNTLVLATGINELVQKNNEATFYPNPFSDIAQLSFPNEGREKYTLNIMEITGRTLKTETTTNSFFQVRKGTLSSGVYFYLLHDEKNKNLYRGKFVID